MKTPIAAFALALSLAVPAAHASSDMVPTDTIKAQITEKLTAEGYQVGKIKSEDGLYEAYAKKDGKRYEIYLDAEMKVVRSKMDD